MLEITPRQADVFYNGKVVPVHTYNAKLCAGNQTFMGHFDPVKQVNDSGGSTAC